MKSNNILIFSDIDGSILGHNDYKLDKISSFLALIIKSFHLIFSSSKTYYELKNFVNKNKIDSPFVVENGSAIFFPKNSFKHLNFNNDFKSNDDYFFIDLGTTIAEIKKFINLNDAKNFILKCQFLHQMKIKEIMSYTGLDYENSKKARQRQYSLPFLWLGSNSQLESFKKFVIKFNLKIIFGGKFFHLSGKSDKGQALLYLKNFYSKILDKELLTVALGDSENDVQMLLKADFSGIIKNDHTEKIKLKKFKNTFYSNSPAPEGWKEILLMINPIKNQIGRNI